jgi:hypothetical protein
VVEAASGIKFEEQNKIEEQKTLLTQLSLPGKISLPPVFGSKSKIQSRNQKKKVFQLQLHK